MARTNKSSVGWLNSRSTYVSPDIKAYGGTIGRSSAETENQIEE